MNGAQKASFGIDPLVGPLRRRRTSRPPRLSAVRVSRLSSGNSSPSFADLHHRFVDFTASTHRLSLDAIAYATVFTSLGPNAVRASATWWLPLLGDFISSPHLRQLCLLSQSTARSVVSVGSLHQSASGRFNLSAPSLFQSSLLCSPSPTSVCACVPVVCLCEHPLFRVP